MNTELKLREEGLENSEFLILTLIVGLTTLLKENAISIRESESCLYNPYTSKCLESLGIDGSIIELIWWGCQVGDVERNIPDKLDESINDILTKSISITKGLARNSLKLDKWIDESYVND